MRSSLTTHGLKSGFIGAIAFASLGISSRVEAAPVTSTHAPQITFATQALEQSDGSWLHEVQVTNHEAVGIWFLNVYTGTSMAYDISASLPEWEANAYIDYAFVGADWSLPGSPDSWTLGFFDALGPDEASLLSGMSMTLSFRTDAPLSSPLAYGYQVQGFSEWNTYTAIGPEAVPEPSALALMGLGLLALAGLASRKKRVTTTSGNTSASRPTASSRVTFFGAFTASILPAFLAFAPQPTEAASDIVISQVYGGGGNSGATLTHDFIELHNRSQNAQDLTGWSVQYASASGSTWQRTLLTGTLAPGGYYLVQQAQGAGGSQALPAPDAAGTIAMSATAGKVALVPSTTILSGPCPTGFLDLIGYGTANCFEGSGAATTLTNTTANLRTTSGCDDTDQNAADFISSTPNPRNTASIPYDCATLPPPPVTAKISDIQGLAHRSTLEGEWVTGVQGVVTAVSSNGFFLQDPEPDANPGTSEALFVFTSSAPTVATGDAVSVNGRVQEFRPGGASGNNLSTTELVTPVVTLISSGNALPDPILLGQGGRMSPAETIDDDATGSVENSGSFDPSSDGIDFYESLEGMLVRVIDPVVVGPTNGFGEFFVLPDAGTGFGLRTPRGGIKVRSSDFNPERLLIDDALTPTPQVKVGDHFASAIEGVLDYNFGNFRILPASLPPVIDGGLQREIADSACPNLLTLATFNVENLDAHDAPAKFAELAAIIVNHLRSPLLVALEEMQDNNGPINDGNTDASLTAATLIAAIQAAGGPTYQYIDIAPQNNQDGGEPGGNIRVGFLYQAAQGLVFIPRPGGNATTAVRALKTPTGIRLSASPGRIDPLNPAFANSRKPLVAEFKYRGRTFFFIANHFNSKGGDQPLMGRIQPPVRSSENQRREQALAVNAFAQSILNLDPSARMVTLGDFNDFEFSETLQTLKGTALVNLMETLPEGERYSYVFEGNSQALDHILVSPTLATAPKTHYDVVHVNAEFANPVSDHEPQRACFE